MKKQSKKWGIRGAAIALTGACLFGGVALAAGDQKDPLITLSYLTKTATPEILKQVEEKAEQRQEDLLKQFNVAIEAYKEEQSEQNESPTGSATYSVVTLSKGQVLSLGIGCEVMLRVGSATVSSGSSPALVDVTSGGSLNHGGGLVANHLYMATIADRYLTATADTVKVLVRGPHSIA